MAKDTFRKVAVERLHSPEQLDKLMKIVGLKGWIALFTLIALVVLIAIWSIVSFIPIIATGKGIIFDPRSIITIRSTSTAIIQEIKVHTGDQIKKGDTLFVLKEGGNIVAPEDGKIIEIDVVVGEEVTSSSILLWLQKPHYQPQFFAFFPAEIGDKIKPGMTAKIELASIDIQSYGLLKGEVKQVLLFGASESEALLKSLPSSEIRKFLLSNEASIQVMIEPLLDPKTPSGFAWTSEFGPPLKIEPGTIGIAKVTIESKKPIHYVFPKK